MNDIRVWTFTYTSGRAVQSKPGEGLSDFMDRLFGPGGLPAQDPMTCGGLVFGKGGKILGKVTAEEGMDQ